MAGNATVQVRLGKCVQTVGAAEEIPELDKHRALRRHMRGDWGEVDQDDAALNNIALTNGGRLLSAYTSTDGKRFWIITEADRSATTILLPEEY